jgi:hypothetical protein
MSNVWADSQQKEGALLVLLAIADFADDDGRAYPSVIALAKKSRLSERQVIRVVRKLEEDGELRVEREPGRHNTHWVTMGRGEKLSPLTPVSPTPDAGVTPTPDTGVMSPLTPVSPEPYIEPSIRTVSEPSRPRKTEVDDNFEEALEDEFWQSFGSREALRDCIAAAMSHSARKKYTDQRAYLRNWIRSDAERRGKVNGRIIRPSMAQHHEEAAAQPRDDGFYYGGSGKKACADCGIFAYLAAPGTYCYPCASARKKAGL